MTAALDLLRSARRPGFLFTGGSARCAFQIGVIETLYGLDIAPAAVLGVSAGAWNAAAVGAGAWRRLRPYWRFFNRMPYLDLANVLREHSPFIWSRLHRRAFDRYVGDQRVKQAPIPIFVALTRLADRASVVIDIRNTDDPFRALLASNYLPPFYTHPLDIGGTRYGDGGWSDNVPYEALFANGCDAVVIVTMKGESEGGLFKHRDDIDHVIPADLRDRVVVIRPRHRLPLGFIERRWSRLVPIADLGALRAREVLLGERHPETEAIAAKGKAPSAYVSALRGWMRRSGRRNTPAGQAR